MMKRVASLAVLCVVCLLALPSSAAAQQKKGDNELLLFGNVSMDPRNSDSASGFLALGSGRFLTDTFQLGIGATISITGGAGGTFNFETGQIEENGVSGTFGYNVFLRKYFGTAKVQPFVGAETFTFDVQDSRNSTYLNILAGLKNYVSERTALDLKAAYGFGSNDQQQVQVTLGITFLF